MIKQKEHNSIIDLTKIEQERTYFCPQIEINLKGLHTLTVEEDHSHTVSLLNGQVVSIPKTWLAFSAVAFANDFTFDMANNNEFETWYLLQGIEKSRTYFFKNMEYTIFNPKKVYIKKSGSHYVVDEKGIIHYIKNTFDNVKSVR